MGLREFSVFQELTEVLQSEMRAAMQVQQPMSLPPASWALLLFDILI
jgi:hypothetical protein